MVRVAECEERLDEVAATISGQLGRLARLSSWAQKRMVNKVRWLVKPESENWW